jgi:Spirocyclase AveC-like
MKEEPMDTNVGHPQSTRSDKPLSTPSLKAPSPAGIWAGLGVIFLLIEAWVLARWVQDGGLRSLPAHGELSPTRAFVIWAWQVMLVLSVLGSLWFAVWTCRRESRLSAFAVLYIGYLTSFWLGPLFNFRDRAVVVSSHTLNVGTWGPYIPGWHGPLPDRQTEAILAVGGPAWGLVVWWGFLTFFVLNRIARHRPGWGLPVQLLVTVPIAIVIELALEVPWALTGTFSWSSGTSLALFPGHWYQLPLYEVLLVMAAFCLPTAVMIYRARQRNTDISILRGSNRVSVRLLAGVGYAQLTVLLYMVAVIVSVALSPGPPPPDTPEHLRLESLSLLVNLWFGRMAG